MKFLFDFYFKIEYLSRHFAVANGFMTSLSYPQMVQGLQLQTNESHGVMHDLSTISSDRAHFYHDKQPMDHNNSTTATSIHNRLNENTSLPIQSLSSKSIEII